MSGLELWISVWVQNFVGFAVLHDFAMSCSKFGWLQGSRKPTNNWTVLSYFEDSVCLEREGWDECEHVCGE